MKIIFLTRALELGGAERQLVELAKGLHARGHNVLVVEFYGGGTLEADLLQAGIRLVNLEKRGRWHNVEFIRRLYELIRQERPDVLHGYLGVPNILAALTGMVCRGIKIIWGVRASDFDLSRYDWLTRVCYRAECLLSSCADLIIANSTAGRDHAIRNGFPENKVMVIPNGIDTVRFIPDRDAGRRVRHEWGVEEEGCLIGLVARVDPMKDHSNFLKAAAIIKDKAPNYRFVSVGRGNSETLANLHAIASELGIQESVIWTGARNDMIAVYNALDIACSSSAFGEGFSNVIGEAMACGIPCVVTDVGDSAWITGDTGVVVPPRDPSALAEGILHLLKHRESTAGERARARIVENFSLERMVTATEAALATLVAESKIV